MNDKIYALVEMVDLLKAPNSQLGNYSLKTFKHFSRDITALEEKQAEYQQQGKFCGIEEINLQIISVVVEICGQQAEILTGGNLSKRDIKGAINNFKILFPRAVVEVKSADDISFSRYWLGGKKC